MSTVQIIAARPWHCGQIARRLRKEQRDGMLALGIKPHADFAEAFHNSVAPKAAFVDSELAALFGVAAPALAPSGFVWLALAERASECKFLAARAIKREFDALHWRNLYTTLLIGDEKAGRLARFLGFDVSRPLPVGWGTGTVVFVSCPRPQEKVIAA